MLQGKYTRKMVAATLLTILMTNTFAPTAALALTSGPTQPEATSFEPIDTTDMVNMQTGNFTYNLPLLEVPGPEGGYPMSLSYHAGIQTNEDASWVGLGWTLNTGAINRNVNGYPDDWTNPSNTSRVYWSGGTSTTYNVGVNIGLANTPLSVNAGLSFSNDTYQGFGVGEQFGLGASYGPLNAGVGIGISPYGGQKSLSGQVGIGAGLAGPISGGLQVEASTNFESLEAGFHGSIGLGSMIRASIGTGQDKPSLSVGGLASTVSSSTAAGIQTETSGWGVAIPINGWLSISLGYHKERYHTDETTTTVTEGSLYSANSANTNTIGDNNAFDTYSLLQDPLEPNYHYLDNPDPTVQQGGAFPAFDDYQVSAQGLGGNMRPYQFQGQVFGQNRINLNPTLCGSPQINCTGRYVQYYSPRTTQDPMPQFRFINDFSNTYQQLPKPYGPGQLTDNGTLNSQPLPFDPAPVYGNYDGTNGYTGFSNNQLAGSKHVDMGIKVKPYRLQGYVKSDRYATGMVEGFSITNESGVTYTFGLPAYSYKEEAYQEKIDHSKGYFLNRQTKNTPYAYTWYLTSVTGPDFVDRNGDGMADDGDWGYWVDFEYGKWNSDYIWRNPSQDYNADEDNEWKDCSIGHKEVYYLNAVRTRSNVALFEKEVRADGKGGANSSFDEASSDPYYQHDGIFDITSASSLQLSHIYLLNSTDENYVTPASGSLNAYVLDATDVNAVGRSNLEAKALRVIDFNYDYSLCANTANSFTTYGQLQGKLTLLGVGTRGKGGASIVPPSRFQYDLGIAAVSQTGVTMSAGNFTTTNGNFNVGDMVTSSSLNTYCGVITQKILSGSTYTYTLVNNNYTGAATAANISTTKNPPYNKDASDAWGLYKSDISTTLLSSDVNSARMTTTVSSAGTDAWSLRSITTQLGAQINMNYESDTYFNSSAEPLPQSLVIDQIQVNPTANTLLLTINKAGNSLIHLTDSYNIGDPLSALLVQEYAYPSGVPPQSQDGSQSYGSFITDTRTNTITFSDNFDNSTTNSLGFGYGLNYYPGQSLTGSLTVQSIDDVNNTITVSCSDPFLLGKGTKTTTLYMKTGGTLTLYNSTAWMTNSYGGNLFIKNIIPLYGGGTRVKSLSMTEQMTGITRITNYGYNDNIGNSSGVSSYTPSMAAPCFDFPGQFSYNFFVTSDIGATAEKSLYYKSYRRILNNNSSNLFSIGRDIPAPGVMYGYVTVSSQVQNADETIVRNIDGTNPTQYGKTQYQFEVFKGNMVGRLPVNSIQTGTTTTPAFTQTARYYALDKFVSCIGNVKSIIEYDDKGNKLTETDNHYLHDNLIVADPTALTFMPAYKALLSQFNYQGYIQERYSEVKLVGQQTNTSQDGMKATISAREEYPCIPTGQTIINYVNGTKTSSYNLAYDFYSGAVTRTVETDAYGNNVQTETVPAYIKYPSMGLKETNANNLNMLTQTAETRVFKVDGILNTSNKLGLVSATSTTWNNLFPAVDIDGSSHIQDGRTETVGSATVPNGNVWRAQSTYSWMPATQTTDGITPYAGFIDFNWTAPASRDARWINTSTITAYDVFSKSLEATDLNGVYSATHMTYGDQRVMLSGTPANYYEIAYSGAEDAGVNQTNNAFVKIADGTVATGAGVAHTGAKSLLLGASGKKGFLYTVNKSQLTAGRAYMASVWVKPVSGTASTVKLYYDIDGAIKTPSMTSGGSQKKAGAWSLINLPITAADIASGTVLHVWCQNDDASVQAYVDDMRFQPVSAITKAYVYDPVSGELTHILDNNNLYTRFEYDAMGRLVRTYKEKLNTTQFSNEEFKTNQYQYNYGATKYVNDPITNVFYSKNNCPLNAGYIGSSVPVTIAGGTYPSYLSIQDADRIAGIYAQDYANTHGSCVCSPQFTFNSSISGVTSNFALSGTLVTFTIGLHYPTGSTYFQAGTVAGSCSFPTGTRTIPITTATAVYNVTVSSTGAVAVQLMSGTAPTGGLNLLGTYDTQVNLYYSDAESSTFLKSCPSGQVGTSYTYGVPAYKYYSAVSLQDADNLALAEITTNGQNAANSNPVGVCSVPCTFSWASAITDPYLYTLTKATTTTESFKFEFEAPSSSYSSGTIGTITGGCLPSATRVVSVTEGNSTNRVWNVTFSTTGSVSVSLTSGSPATNLQHPILLTGTYNL